MQISKITKKQALDILKAVCYVSLSAALAYLITLTTNNPDMFGPFTILVNGLLVTIKKAFTPGE